jgi:hypothetical protein
MFQDDDYWNEAFLHADGHRFRDRGYVALKQMSCPMVRA